MVETLAVTAAAVQFVDVGGRVLVKLSRLCSDLKRAPKAVRTAKNDLKALVGLVGTIGQDFQAARTGPATSLNGAVSLARLATAASYLQECLNETSGLLKILNGLDCEPADSAAKKVWRAVVSVKEEKKISEGLARLDQIKSNLFLWYQHETLVLVNNQLLPHQTMFTVVQETNSKVLPFSGQLASLENNVRSNEETVQRSLKQNETAIVALNQGMTRIDRTLGDMSTQLQATSQSVEALMREVTIGHDANGSPDEPLPPLALALGWRSGIDVLLRACADPLIPVQIAIARGLVSEVEVLLEFNCPLFQATTYRGMRYESLLDFALGYHFASATGLMDDTRDNIVTLVIKAIVKSRYQLMDLATQKLSSSQLGILSPQIRRGETLLNEDATWAVDALEAAGFTVPPFLWPGEYPSIYHHQRLLASRYTEIFDIGFRSVDVEDGCGLTPALCHCYELHLDEALWFLSRGARFTDFLASQPLNLVAAAALATGYGSRNLNSYRDGPWYPPRMLEGLSLDQLIAACSPTLSDTCNCPCSSHGCSTTTYLFKRFFGSWRATTDLVSYWLQATHATPTKLQSSYAEICRLELFDRLDMAHVCCRYVEYRPSYGGRYHVRKWLNPDEEQELRDEDEPWSFVLEEYMQLYKNLRKDHSGPFLVFWDAWWGALTHFLPELIEVLDSYQIRWEPVEVKAPQAIFDSGRGSISWASYGLDGQIRDAVRSRLGYRDGEDVADIFADATAYLFQGYPYGEDVADIFADAMTCLFHGGDAC